jgi:HrpA-like RNA helicase
MLMPGNVIVKPHYDEAAVAKMTPKDYFLLRRAATKKRRGPNDCVLIVRAGAGSGKSTTVPAETWMRFYRGNKPLAAKNIAVTQPRVLTSTDIPIDVAALYGKDGIKMGENIGYQTGSFTFKPPRGIIFMTIGVLAQQLKTMADEDLIALYGDIILDEAHDRSIEMDTVLVLVRQFLDRNWKSAQCPHVTIMSATLNAARFAGYFGVPIEDVIDIKGINFPVRAIWPKSPIGNFMRHALGLVLSIHRKNVNDYMSSNRFTDILVFVPGAAHIKELRRSLDAENINNSTGEDDEDPNHYVVISLTRESYQTKSIDFQNIFRPLAAIRVECDGRSVVPKRRIIISTNIAETGVTIDTLRYVIDTGYMNTSVFNPIYGATALLPQPVTQANADQRKGRVGRRAPGNWYPLYTHETYDELHPEPIPDIWSSNVTTVMLALAIKAAYPSWDGTLAGAAASAGSIDLDNLGLMDPPSSDGLAYAMERLFVLGLIDSRLRPTPIGLLASHLPKIDMCLVRMILAGYEHGAHVIDLVTIAAFATVGKSSYKNTVPGHTPYSPHDVVPEDIGCDFIESLWAWNEFMAALSEDPPSSSTILKMREFCESAGLQYDGMLAVVATRDDIMMTMLEKMGLGLPHRQGGAGPASLDASRSSLAVLKRCIYDGFRLNTATWNQDSLTYQMDADARGVGAVPITVDSIYVRTRPRKIVYKQLAYRKPAKGPLYRYSADTICVIDDYDDTFCVS